jgi:predicted DNA-binding antitoxin AbrB/MazE fold protein
LAEGKKAKIMTMTVEAIYEQGVLRLKEPVSLEDGAHVDVIVITREPASGNAKASEILADIAALPLEGNGEEFSGRDHDRILYEKG